MQANFLPWKKKESVVNNSLVVCRTLTSKQFTPYIPEVTRVALKVTLSLKLAIILSHKLPCYYLPLHICHLLQSSQIYEIVLLSANRNRYSKRLSAPRKLTTYLVRKWQRWVFKHGTLKSLLFLIFFSAMTTKTIKTIHSFDEIC